MLTYMIVEAILTETMESKNVQIEMSCTAPVQTVG